MYQIGKIILFMFDPKCLRADVLEKEALQKLGEDLPELHKDISVMLDAEPSKRPDPSTVIS